MAGSIYDWSVTAASNSNADAEIAWPEGQAPSTVNDSARSMMRRLKQLLIDIGGSIAAGGTANGLTVTASSPFTALADGQIVSFRATASNTAAATLNVNSIGAKAIQKMGSTGDTALIANDIRSTGIYVVQYSAALNGAAGAWLLLNPTPGAAATITPPSAQVFSGNGTWNRPTGCTRIVIEAVAGGGAGGNVDGVGGGSGAAGGGGASGFYGKTIPLDVSAVASAAVTIGAAGAVAGGASADGGSGGNTTITIGATTYTWGGGTGGGGMAAATGYGSQDGGAPGTGTNVVGFSQPGGLGVWSGTDTNATGGNGASSPLGSGGKGQHRVAAGGAGGLAAAGFGGGGGGACNTNSAANNVGGAGTGGYMRIWEYYS